MSDLIIHWPDAQAEQVQAARGRLEVAAPVLAERPREQVVGVLGRVLDRFRDPESDWHIALRESTVENAAFSREMVAAALEFALEGWHRDALAELVVRELGAAQLAKGRTIAPFPVTSVILAGAIPMPNLLACLLPLLVGSTVLIKPASRDPMTPVLLARCVADLDAELGRCLEVISFPSTDSKSLSQFLSSECVVASGSDGTITEIASRLAPSQCFVGYGHKFSLAVVHAPSLLQAENCREIARALSVDIALWDQLGCLSPVCVYVLGNPAAEAAERLLDALAEALAERAREWPRGEVPKEVRAAIKQERDEAEMRIAGGEKLQLRQSRETDWTVIAETSPEWRPTPRHRFIRLAPVGGVDALLKTLGPLAPHLSSVALAGFESVPSESRRLAQGLGRLGACRVCGPGRLQAPPVDWHRDGRPVLLPLTRFLEIEPERST